MARGGINKAVVQIAREALLARGQHPSIDAVRVELGNTGSKSTIQRYLKELGAREQAQPPTPRRGTAQLCRRFKRSPHGTGRTGGRRGSPAPAAGSFGV